MATLVIVALLLVGLLALAGMSMKRRCPVCKVPSSVSTVDEWGEDTQEHCEACDRTFLRRAGILQETHSDYFERA